MPSKTLKVTHVYRVWQGNLIFLSLVNSIQELEGNFTYLQDFDTIANI